MHIRHTFAAAAVSAIALGGLVAAPASADEEAPVNCAQVEEDAKDAKASFLETQKAFRASSRPMAKLIKEERADARVEARQSRRDLRDMVKELDKADRKEFRKLARQIRAEARQIAKANRLVRSDKAVREQVKDERRAARQERKVTKAAWDEAKQAWLDVQVACEEPTTDETIIEAPTTEVDTGA